MTTSDRTLTRHILLRPVRAWGVVAATLVAVAAFCDLASSWATWNAYFLAEKFIDGDIRVALDDLQAADATTSTLAFLYLGAIVIAGTAFVIWLQRSRWNSEILCDARHRHTTGWVVGSWVCPVVNLWFPFQVVSDIWKASNPTTPKSADLVDVQGSGVLALWWTCWIGRWIADRVAVVLAPRANTATLDKFQSFAIAETLAATLSVAAAVLIIMVMRKLITWQENARQA